ncbi:DUF4231 domain-containing protein [Streptomyces mangrovi]|uniref:DUF4231 domain-containing protein n=1 Tax=Streptomyces mangrovi TaxID=1206892 RepID=UPI00399CA2D8
MSSSNSENTTDALIEYRRQVADLKQRIKNRRLQVWGFYGTPIIFVVTIFVWSALKVFIWLHGDIPSAVNGLFGGILFALAVSIVPQVGMEFGDETHWKDARTPVKELKLELELTEEARILEARKLTPPALERQASYKERVPGEIARLRKESRHYRRIHLFMQWLLFVSSAGVSAITAWYDPPQPGKGVLIILGFTVTVVTAAAGYFKPRERAFNLQQTADSMEQHNTALELGIAPYTQADKVSLELFATTVEELRMEQRKREQQLDQPHQGQQGVI